MSATPCRVSDVAAIEDASLSYSSIPGWVESGRGQQFVDLMRGCWRSRAYGDFWSYMLLAEGGVDIACEPELALHDMAACSIVVTEAGGRFTDLDGDPRPARGERRRHQRPAARRRAGAAGARPTTSRRPLAGRPWPRARVRQAPGQNDAMQLTHTFEIAAPVDQVFDVFGRLDLLAPCFPGAIGVGP